MLLVHDASLLVIGQEPLIETGPGTAGDQNIPEVQQVVILLIQISSEVSADFLDFFGADCRKVNGLGLPIFQIAYTAVVLS